jgi:hypothetical protein
MTFLSNLFSRAPSDTICLTNAVIKLWTEQPDQWTEKRTRCIIGDGCVYDGYELTHKTHDIVLCVPLFLGQEGDCWDSHRFTARAGKPIFRSDEIARIKYAITEIRPYAALVEYRTQMAAARAQLNNTIDSLTKIGCQHSI